jgi:hypothetical protein
MLTLSVLCLRVAGIGVVATVGVMLAIGVVPGVSAATSSANDEAVEYAALAPYDDFLHKEAKNLCDDFVPAVAGKLFGSVSPGRGCEEAAAEAFTRYEVLALGPEPAATTRTVYARLGRAWADLRFSRGPTQLIALRRVAGRWRVSSSAFALLSTCPGPATGAPCYPGSKVLRLATIESAEITFIPAAVRRAGTWELREYEAGSGIAARSGCLACHRIGEDGHEGPGPNLTHVGAQLDEQQLVHAVTDARAPMPSFSRLPRAKLAVLTRFLSLLR